MSARIDVFCLMALMWTVVTSCHGVSGGADATGGDDAVLGDVMRDGRVLRDGVTIDAAQDGAGDLLAEACPSYGVAQVAGVVEARDLDEVSGIVASRHQADVLWVHNDSGDKARIYAIDTHGRLLERFRLKGITARDWEDIALGAGPTPGKDYLYIGDIGDNHRVRAEIQIVRVAEPHIIGGGQKEEIAGAETFTLRYPDGAHNAETLLIDPRDGTIYIVTKEKQTLRSQVFRVPVKTSAHAPAAPLTLVEESILAFGQGNLASVKSGILTGGDIAPDGSSVLLRTYGDVLYWPIDREKSLSQALTGVAPCRLPVAWEVQGESVAFAAKGGDYFTLSEGDTQALYRYPRR